MGVAGASKRAPECVKRSSREIASAIRVSQNRDWWFLCDCCRVAEASLVKRFRRREHANCPQFTPFRLFCCSVASLLAVTI
jgi:hypothetical protein